MTHFKWSLQAQPDLSIKTYTQADYLAVKAREKPDRRSRQDYIVKVHLDVHCDCGKHKDSQQIHPLEGLGHGSVDTAQNQLDAFHQYRTDDSPLSNSVPLGFDCTTMQRAGKIDDIVQSDIRNNVGHGGPPDTSPMRISRDEMVIQHYMPHDVPDPDLNGEQYTAQVVDSLQVMKEHTSSAADRLPMAPWMPATSTLLLELKDEAQLSWAEITAYFPGRSKSALSQHYFRLKKSTAMFAAPGKRRSRSAARVKEPLRTRMTQRMTHDLRTVHDDMQRKSQLSVINDISSSVLARQLPQSSSGRQRFRPKYHIKDGYS